MCRRAYGNYEEYDVFAGTADTTHMIRINGSVSYFSLPFSDFQFSFEACSWHAVMLLSVYKKKKREEERRREWP